MEARRKNVRADAGGDTAAVHRLPSDILESIFFRLPSLLHLVRAACACRRWRRVIADGCFLRNFRALRVPGLVAGGYCVGERYYGLRPAGYDPMFFPSKTSPLKYDVDEGLGHFSLEFLPERGGEPWEIADRRGFLYLLLNDRTNDAVSSPFPDFVICEPFTGNYRVIPPLAGFDGCRCMGAFLLDGEEAHGHVALSGFRVLCTLYRDGVARSCVFSSISGSWTVERCTADCGMDLLPGPYSIFFAGQCATCAYWMTVKKDNNTLLVLNKHTAEFSSHSLPAKTWRWWNRYGIRVVRREHSTAHIVYLTNDMLTVLRQEVEAGGWVLEAGVQLSEAMSRLPGFKDRYLFTPWKIVSETKGRVVLFEPWNDGWLISLDLETMEFKLAGDRDGQYLAHPYELPWPPVRPCSPV